MNINWHNRLAEIKKELDELFTEMEADEAERAKMPERPATLKVTTPTSQHVIDFAGVMEKKLSENRHKGDVEGWRELKVGKLLAAFDDEVLELREAILKRERWDKVEREAADVANFIMMVADVYKQRTMTA